MKAFPVRPPVAGALLLALATPSPAPGMEVPEAVAYLEVLSATPGYLADGAPARFVLMEDGGVYAGGTREILVGRLTDRERKDLEKQIRDVRKLPDLGGAVSVGPGEEKRHLILRRGRPLEVVVTGDLTRPHPQWRRLAAFLQELEAFQHPTLRPFTPTSYALRAREGTAAGGCRAWTLPDPLKDSVFAPRVVPAEGLGDWPTGANPATVCHEDKTYRVTFRPLVPGERP